VKFEINPLDFIEAIAFDPRIDDSLFKTEKENFSKNYNFSSSRISKSTLYDFKPITIQLQ
jgi:hypothetical protein